MIQRSDILALRGPLIVLLAASAAIASFGAIAIYFGPTVMHAYEYHTLTSGAKVGWSRQQVLAHLGKPNHTAETLHEVQSDKGTWSPVPDRPVEKEVLIYVMTDRCLYVYIDKQDRVTYVLYSET